MMKTPLQRAVEALRKEYPIITRFAGFSVTNEEIAAILKPFFEQRDNGKAIDALHAAQWALDITKKELENDEHTFQWRAKENWENEVDHALGKIKEAI